MLSLSGMMIVRAFKVYPFDVCNLGRPRGSSPNYYGEKGSTVHHFSFLELEHGRKILSIPVLD